MRECFLFRHAKSSHNPGSDRPAVFAGNELDTSLTQKGRTQAASLIRSFTQVQGIGALGGLATSPLQRARQTTDIFYTYLSKQGISIPVREFAELRELSVGEFVHLTRQEVTTRYPEVAAAFYSGDVRSIDFPNGESFSDVAARAQWALDLIHQAFSTVSVVGIIGHAMFNQVLLYSLGERNFSHQFGYPHNQVLHVRLVRENGKWQAGAVEALLPVDDSEPLSNAGERV